MDDQPRVGNQLDLTVSFHIDETQQIASTATSGVWRLQVDGHTTSDIPYDCTWRDVEAALQVLPAVGSDGAQCWGGPHPGLPIGVRLLGKRQRPALTVEDTDLDGELTVTTVEDGGPIILDAPPTVTVNHGAALDVEHLGGGVYRAVFTPPARGGYRWEAVGASALHGEVRAVGRFDAR